MATTVASCLAATAQVVGIAEAGDVVADDRAGRARGVEHRRAPGVDRERHVEAGVQRLDRGHDAVELLGSRRPPARARPSRRRRRAGRRRRRRAARPGARTRRSPRSRRGRRTNRACGSGCPSRRRGVRTSTTRSPSRRVGNGSTGTEAGYRRARGERATARPSAPRASIRNGTAAPARATAGDPRDQHRGRLLQQRAEARRDARDRRREEAVDAEQPRPRARRRGWRPA